MIIIKLFNSLAASLSTTVALANTGMQFWNVNTISISTICTTDIVFYKWPIRL